MSDGANSWASVPVFSPASPLPVTPYLASSTEQKFDLATQITKLDRANLLFMVISKFADLDLHPDAVSNLEMGYLMAGFNVPAGTSLYAPFDGDTGVVSLEDYSSGESGSYEGLSLTAPGSMNGIYAYNVAGEAETGVKAGDIFAEVTSEQYIFPKYYKKVNLILEFNLFDVDAEDYDRMRSLFEEIIEHLLKT